MENDEETEEETGGQYLGDSECPYCREEMAWCTTCSQYTSTCCEDYGTCQCC
jgi:hypothetical protein